MAATPEDTTSDDRGATPSSDDVGLAEKVDQRRVVEGPAPFSRLSIWDHQRRYYDQRGNSAWSSGRVPHYITSNAFIAGQYADVILGYAADVADLISPERPLTILELGCGPARFSHHLLHSLYERMRGFGGRTEIPFRLVMSDFTRSNIDGWLEHPRFQAWFDAGLLDVAHFDMSSSTELHLERSGLRFAADEPTGPLVVIANYVFDSIPADVFLYEDGGLVEVLATWLVAPEVTSQDDPEVLFDNTTVRWTARLTELPYYDEPGWNDLLASYTATPDKGILLFPTGALGCIDRLRSIAGDDLVLLSSDKGFFFDADVHEGSLPRITSHGAISTNCNYHAIARYFEAVGGEVWAPADRTPHLCTVGFATSGPGRSTGVARRTFAAGPGRFSPDHFYMVQTFVTSNDDRMGIEQILSHLALSNFDAEALALCTARLVELMPELSETAATVLARSVERAVDRYLPIGDDRDPFHPAGSLLATVHEYRKAYECFELSLAWFGPNAEVEAKRDECRARLAAQEPDGPSGPTGADERDLAPALPFDTPFDPLR